MVDDETLAALFRESARAAGRRAPLYRRFGEAIAADPPVARLLTAAPPDQRLPVLLYACVHWILLREPDHHHDLRRWYPNLADDDPDADPPDHARAGDDRAGDDAAGDPYPAFREFCLGNAERLAAMLATRSTQTNEVGRCALFAPVLAAIAADHGPLAHLDVGASAGLNLLADRYHYRYEPDDAGHDAGTGHDAGAPHIRGTPHDIGPDSPVRLVCGTRGPVPLPSRLAPVVDRIGLDRDPIDPTDPDAADWLRACVWPDRADRFARLGAAIELAAADPPRVVAGDAVDDLATVADRLHPDAHLVVTDSWALNYLAGDRRAAFVEQLDAIGAERPLSWCAVESPAMTPELPWPSGIDAPDLTHLLRVDWTAGGDGTGGVDRHVSHLGVAHPHGDWLHWFPLAAPTSARGARSRG